MAHLDLDTTALAGAGSRARTASSALAAAGAFGGVEESRALAITGDETLAAALTELAEAWSSTRAALAADLDTLGDALRSAAQTYAQAEGLTAAGLAVLLVPPEPAGPAAPGGGA